MWHLAKRVSADIRGFIVTTRFKPEDTVQFMQEEVARYPELEVYRNDAPIPDELFDKMVAAKNFQAGMQMVRQLEFSLFDFRIHAEYDPDKGTRVQEILDEVRAEVAVIRPPEYHRFQHSFSHIFSGGYAAGYYSYKWAEVLSSDAFSKFEETGIFNRDTGLAFLEAVLEQGGSRDPMELFVEFRGREPSIDALLRHSGLAA